MRGRVRASRTGARFALVGLTVGLFALAGLALSSTVSTRLATSQVRQLNVVADQWG
jgi:hypothetical protein